MILQGPFAELERKIVDQVFREALRIIDQGVPLGGTLASALDDENLKQRLRETRDELKHYRVAPKAEAQADA